MQGIGLGVIFSLIYVLKALAFPNDAVLGQSGVDDFHDLNRDPRAKAIPGVMVYRFSGPLFFANCGVLRSRAEELINQSPVPLHGFILDASAIFDVDLAACEVLSELNKDLRARGIRLLIANLQGPVRDRLLRGWEVAATDPDIFFSGLGAAVIALRQQRGQELLS
jgi:MFS superfamily sulfate permease-like transporter